MRLFASLTLVAALAVGLTACDAVSSADAALADASENSAIVTNWGDGGTCAFFGGFSGGTGRVTEVSKDGVLTQKSCQGELNDPDAAPDRATKVDFTCVQIGSGQLIVTPSGRFNYTCHANQQ